MATTETGQEARSKRALAEDSVTEVIYRPQTYDYWIHTPEYGKGYIKIPKGSKVPPQLRMPGIIKYTNSTETLTAGSGMYMTGVWLSMLGPMGYLVAGTLLVVFFLLRPLRSLGQVPRQLILLNQQLQRVIRLKERTIALWEAEDQLDRVSHNSQEVATV